MKIGTDVCVPMRAHTFTCVCVCVCVCMHVNVCMCVFTLIVSVLSMRLMIIHDTFNAVHTMHVFCIKLES